MTEKQAESRSSVEPDLSRRNLLKYGTLGATAFAASSISGTAFAREDGIGIVEHDEFPAKIDPDVYQRFDEKNQTFSINVVKHGRPSGLPQIDESKPGFTTVDQALNTAAWSLNRTITVKHKMVCKYGAPRIQKPRKGVEPYQFSNNDKALAQIKRAAMLFGARVVGVARRDERWDYGNFFDRTAEIETPWAAAVDFEPKSVIVMGVEQDYEGMASAPSLLSGAAVGEGYSSQTKVAFQMASFMNELGYKAIASGNGVGLSVPYAVMAGLGEPSRAGLLINYKYGPRLRFSKVYTDLELEEYDKPITFGVKSFCENCMRCADNCPAKAISKDVKQTMAPKDPARFNNPGVEKWYVDCGKCHQYWYDSGTSCSTCITSCPYNKPDFWHHRLIDKLNTVLPGPMHKFMAEMDKWHGYGNTFDPNAPAVFWSDKGRSYDGRKK